MRLASRYLPMFVVAACAFSGGAIGQVTQYLSQADFDNACRVGGLISTSGVDVRLRQEITLTCSVTVQVKGGDLYIDRRVYGRKHSSPQAPGLKSFSLTLNTTCGSRRTSPLNYCGSVYTSWIIDLSGSDGALGIDANPEGSGTGGQGGTGGSGGFFTVNTVASANIYGGVITSGANGGNGGSAGFTTCGGGQANGGHGGTAGKAGDITISQLQARGSQHAIRVASSSTTPGLVANGANGGAGGTAGPGSVVGCGGASGSGGNGMSGSSGGTVRISGKYIEMSAAQYSPNILANGGSGAPGANAGPTTTEACELVGDGKDPGASLTDCPSGGPINSGAAGLSGNGANGGAVKIVAGATLQGSIYAEANGGAGANGTTGSSGGVMLLDTCEIECCGSGRMSPDAGDGGSGGDVSISGGGIWYSASLSVRGGNGGWGDGVGNEGRIAASNACPPECRTGYRGGNAGDGGNGGSIAFDGSQIGYTSAYIDNFGGSGGNGGNAGGHNLQGGTAGNAGAQGLVSNTTQPPIDLFFSPFLPSDGVEGNASGPCPD